MGLFLGASVLTLVHSVVYWSGKAVVLPLKEWLGKTLADRNAPISLSHPPPTAATKPQRLPYRYTKYPYPAPSCATTAPSATSESASP